jgi:hypothetical protein
VTLAAIVGYVPDIAGITHSLRSFIPVLSGREIDSALLYSSYMERERRGPWRQRAELLTSACSPRASGPWERMRATSPAGLLPGAALLRRRAYSRWRAVGPVFERHSQLIRDLVELLLLIVREQIANFLIGILADSLNPCHRLFHAGRLLK